MELHDVYKVYKENMYFEIMLANLTIMRWKPTSSEKATNDTFHMSLLSKYDGLLQIAT